jgi:hypothetical protein
VPKQNKFNELNKKFKCWLENFLKLKKGENVKKFWVAGWVAECLFHVLLTPVKKMMYIKIE